MKWHDYSRALITAAALVALPTLAFADDGNLQRNIDSTWVLTAAALVMVMQVGFLLLEAGMVRSKNSINVAQKNLLDFLFAVTAFWFAGFMIGFGPSGSLPFGMEPRYLLLNTIDSNEAAFFVFQVMFCGTAATIVSGAVAERMRLMAYVIGSCVLSLLIYPLFLHWAWGGALGPASAAFLGNAGFVDFAGSTVVHATGGWVSLAACLVIGARRGRFGADGTPVRIAGHNPVLAITGGFFLYIGWIGFNGGSTLHAGASVAPIILNTILAGAVGGIAGYVQSHLSDGCILPEKPLNGMLGGLVAITAGCHVLTPAGAGAIGVIGSLIALYANDVLEKKLHIDDAVGAIGVHGFAGVAGTLGLAVLAPAGNLPTGDWLAQLQVQALGAGVNFCWTFAAGYVLFWALKRFSILRVDAEEERIGLNMAEHGTRLGVGHIEAALEGLVNGTADLRMRLPHVEGDESEDLTRMFNRLLENLEDEERTRSEIETKLRTAEEAERVSALSNATFEGIVMHKDGIILDSNNQLANLVGLTVKDLIGRSMFDFLGPSDGATVQEMVRRNASEQYEVTVVAANGDQIPCAIRGRKIVFRGQEVQIGCIVDLRERKAAERNMAYLAQHDPLTQLANRALFNDRLARAVGAATEAQPAALLLIDLDRFKFINDLHGHQAGDAVICETARRIESVVPANSTVARLGGDEFAVIVEGVEFQTQVEDLAHRIVQLSSASIRLDGGTAVDVGASVGVAIGPRDGDDAETLFARADTALYHSKKLGRNCYNVFKPGMNELMERRRELEGDMDKALQRGEFEVYFQPRVSVATSRITGYEALLRWNHPDRGQISPQEFIPVAEACGKIVSIGAWILRQACTAAVEHFPGQRISVNISPVQFQRAEFVEEARRTVEETGIRPGLLELEITESMLLGDDYGALKRIEKLKSLGFSIALDDFGTGYSSLSYLSKFPFDTIKIDRSFVSGIETNENARLIARTVVDLANSMGKAIVAEGVETAAQAEFLIRCGCGELQGYLLGKPLPISEAIEARQASFEDLLAFRGRDEIDDQVEKLRRAWSKMTRTGEAGELATG
ncbi:Bacteriophytochrome cph2 [Hartmannibacter diazotrophicus]|uniref:Bacteriophytochrome cph2 n=1 Tax=Hartmannibacter diazotrophicus TaxID=1482074 RepID=A0A2C9D0C9_9HYPH|nr:ammonium transporter [Hartmannibacter diazotrophicus]SON53694.1 Bacteriophytochrome cph2 [Hartmannibacter diazotrophicus]